MKALKLERYYTPLGTFGYLYDETGQIFCCTVEEVWRDNRPSEPGREGSCIPEGGYLCKRVNRPKHGDCFEVQDVPSRSAILFHIGNTTRDIEGCVALGNKFGYSASRWAIMDSGSVPDGAYHRFMRHLNGDQEFMLLIKRADNMDITYGV